MTIVFANSFSTKWIEEKSSLGLPAPFTRCRIFRLTLLVVFLNPASTGGFLKWWYPQITHFNRVFHHKPSISGYHHLRKHPTTGSLEPFLKTHRFRLRHLLPRKLREPQSEVKTSLGKYFLRPKKDKANIAAAYHSCKEKPGRFHLDEWTPWDVFVTVNGQLPWWHGSRACFFLHAATGYEAVIPNDLAGKNKEKIIDAEMDFKEKVMPSKPSNDSEMIWPKTLEQTT